MRTGPRRYTALKKGYFANRFCFAAGLQHFVGTSVLFDNTKCIFN
jgi:hypothetical protein